MHRANVVGNSLFKDLTGQIIAEEDINQVVHRLPWNTFNRNKLVLTTNYELRAPLINFKALKKISSSFYTQCKFNQKVAKIN